MQRSAARREMWRGAEGVSGRTEPIGIPAPGVLEAPMYARVRVICDVLGQCVHSVGAAAEDDTRRPLLPPTLRPTSVPLRRPRLSLSLSRCDLSSLARGPKCIS
jgi:hypothetical protein